MVSKTVFLTHTQPTTDEKGQRLKTPVELANVWSQFLGRKFATTDLECMRAEYETLPARKDGEGDFRGRNLIHP